MSLASKRFLFPWRASRTPNRHAGEDPAHSVLHTASLPEMRDSYLRLVERQLDAGGIPRRAVHVQMIVAREADNRCPTFTAMLKLVACEERDAVRMLLGLPLLERKLRRVLANHWLAEVSHFAGVWLHAAAPSRDPELLQALRQSVLALERTEHSDSLWSTLAPLSAGNAPNPAKGAAAARPVPQVAPVLRQVVQRA